MRKDITSPKRTAIVTGGSSGIGRAFVASLHRGGWQVVTCGRDAGKLAGLAKDFPGIHTHLCDVGDKASVEAFVDLVSSVHHDIKLLINNAGGMRELDFTQPDLLRQDLTQEIRANLEGVINLTAGLLPMLRASSPSHIIMVSSGYGLVPVTRAPVYSASKAGLRSFTKALRRQLKGQGVTITDVAPPAVDTPAALGYQGKKISPQHVAELTLAAAMRGQEEVYPGETRWLPWMMRLAPRWIENLVAKS
ncbi:SDR family oxidoreductase [Aquabacterium sp.]|uniref:SDR family oxidoreductase n=1 Tax=Aquabacterium sp. TaxID=1872578 RepID=UPI003D6CCF56